MDNKIKIDKAEDSIGNLTLDVSANNLVWEHEKFTLTFNDEENLLTVDDKHIIDVSDGHHTTSELYDHRMTLYTALLSFVNKDENFDCYWSRQHHDGSMFGPNWIIVCMNNLITGEQVSYHLDISYIDLLNSAGIREIEKSDVWDGHSPEDVLDRIKLWFIK